MTYCKINYRFTLSQICKTRIRPGIGGVCFSWKTVVIKKFEFFNDNKVYCAQFFLMIMLVLIYIANSLKTSIFFILLRPGQDVKRYPISIQLNNQKVFRSSGHRTKYFERLFYCRSITYHY